MEIYKAAKFSNDERYGCGVLMLDSTGEYTPLTIVGRFQNLECAARAAGALENVISINAELIRHRHQLRLLVCFLGGALTYSLGHIWLWG